jgi:hypothetical protein
MEEFTALRGPWRSSRNAAKDPGRGNLADTMGVGFESTKGFHE